MEQIGHGSQGNGIRNVMVLLCVCVEMCGLALSVMRDGSGLVSQDPIRRQVNSRQVLPVTNLLPFR